MKIWYSSWGQNSPRGYSGWGENFPHGPLTPTIFGAKCPPPPNPPRGFLWFTCPSGTWIWKSACPAKIFTCPANICTSSIKVMNTAGKISTCPDWKTTCPVGHITTTVYVPWDKINMPQACGHTLMSNAAESLNLSRSHRALNKLSQNWNE